MYSRNCDKEVIVYKIKRSMRRFPKERLSSLLILGRVGCKPDTKLSDV